MTSTWFWQNYEVCRKWQNTHKGVLMEVASANNQVYGGYIPTSSIPTERIDANYKFHDISSDRATSEKDDSVHDRLDEQEEFEENDHVENEYPYNDLQLKFEVNQDFLDFLEISMKHKQELKMKRMKESQCFQNRTQNQANKHKNPSEEENSGFKDGRKATPAPKCPVGEMRLEEMKLLYGSAAHKIQGMETALQLSFNKKCDVFNPKFWPTEPLNLVE